MAKVRATESMTVPMAPMIDVTFQLLIYFVLTFKEELPEAHLQVNLPSPDKAPPSQTKPPPVLELKVLPGQIILQGVPRPLETIKEQLAYLGKLDPDQTVLVKTSPLAKTEELVLVLDLCRGANLTKLNVLTLR